MPKQFFTEKDIEDLFKRGVTVLEVSDDVVLTDLAYEKANRLGMKLARPGADKPPAAPVRPYLSQKSPAPALPPMPAPVLHPPQVEKPVPAAVSDEAELQQRIRSAVTARLGNQVDASLLDAIIKRVLASTGLK